VYTRNIVLKKPKKILRNFCHWQMFFPGFLGMFINPFYFARKGLAEHMKSLARNIKGKVLDVGCGSKPYEKLCQYTSYIGLELDTEENRKHKCADYFYNGHHFPFEDESFDSVMANQVFEHVFNPDEFLDEVNRVLQRGGGISDDRSFYLG